MSQKNLSDFILEQVSVDYINNLTNRPALQEISFSVLNGTWVAIAGNNGSGKSTLAKIMSGISPISSGNLQVRKGLKVHMVMQNPETQLLGETIYEELNLSLPTEVSDRTTAITLMLNQVGLNKALNTPIQQLSGGQKQLLNIASCLAANAGCILFDEATSMLDADSRQLVLNAATQLHHEGKTIIWVSHRMEELVHADRVLLLHEGRLVFDGSHETFFYGSSLEIEANPSPCEQYGFEPPYLVLVTRELHRLGYKLPARHLQPQQWSQTVRSLCR